ncbi:hypothetical protein HOY82DRAFT_540732 [Tuber indicum]|nr:hypothetical protein HOY82DRAFT_540732 [Tuber indicum]
MITGLVYTELNGNGNPQDEALRIKNSLAIGTRLIHSNPGHSLILFIQQMENQLTTLQRKVDDHDEALRAERETRQAETTDHNKALRVERETRQAETAAQKQATELLEKQMQALTHEVMILRSLKPTAIFIREHFFATHQRSEDDIRIDDPLAPSRTSPRLLLGSTQLVEAMNARATGITNSYRVGWSFEDEAKF